VAFTTQHAPLLNWGCAACTVLGVLIQLLRQRRQGLKHAVRATAPAKNWDLHAHHAALTAGSSS
jgi:hypothetical protein